MREKRVSEKIVSHSEPSEMRLRGTEKSWFWEDSQVLERSGVEARVEALETRKNH